MLTETRWQKEQELMRSVFPEFIPFTRGSRFGFEGCLKGPRSNQVYRVTIEAEEAIYPQAPPMVRMVPRIGIHWIGEGDRRRLCVQKEWRPARSTFANTLLALVRYLDEQDAPACVALPLPPAEETRRTEDDTEIAAGGWRNLWTAVSFWRTRGPAD